MKLEIVHVDTCLPDYWQGHHKAHLQIAVWRGMSLRDIKSALRSEISQGAIMGSDSIAEALSSCSTCSHEEQERIYRKAYAAINRIKPAKKGKRKFFLDLEEVDEDDGLDSVYAYFVFVEI